MDLQGIWRFGLDEKDIGIGQKWYCQELSDSIQISGTLQAQGYGSEINTKTPLIDGLHDRLWFLREETGCFAEDGAVRIPFLAQPKRHYLGAAWYQRDIEIPEEWEGRQLTLFMELVRWKSTVWMDDVCMGSFTSLCVPHRYRIGSLPAGSHRLTVRVDNRMIYPYRPDAHGVSDSVGHSWNGIAGKVELTAQNMITIEKAAVYPDYRSKSASVKISFVNMGEEVRGRLVIHKTINCLGIGRTMSGGEESACLITVGQNLPDKVLSGDVENAGFAAVGQNLLDEVLSDDAENAGITTVGKNLADMVRLDDAENAGFAAVGKNLSDKVLSGDAENAGFITVGKGSTEVEFCVGFGEEALCWDEFTPEQQELDIRLLQGDGILLAQKTVRFGLRNIAVSGRKFLLNGRTICFRGTHDAGCFPLTGYPAPDVEAWRRIFSICREWGMNHVRFHSWCPPEAAFQAADEAGVYLQIETGMWNYFTPDGEIAEQLFLETDRILEAYGNHPSFVMLSSGNEPHGSYKPVVERWVEKYRREDGRRLYCAQSGWLWPMNPEDLHITDYLYT